MGQAVYIQEYSYLIFLRHYLSLFGFNWIIYSLKSHTSKRKSKNAFTENIKINFYQEDASFIQDARS